MVNEHVKHKCFIVEERIISRTYSELVKQESVCFFASPVLMICTHKLLTKIESYFSDRLTFLSGRSSHHLWTNSTTAFSRNAFFVEII